MPRRLSRAAAAREFNFLGYSFGRMYSARTGKAYLGFRPVSRDRIDDLSVVIIPQHGAANDRNASHRRFGARTKGRELPSCKLAIGAVRDLSSISQAGE